MIDLAKDFGLSQKPYPTQDVIDTPLSMGMSVADVQARFPSTYAMLSLPEYGPGLLTQVDMAAGFVQPAVEANVTITVDTTAGMRAYGGLRIIGGGWYVVVTVNSGTSVTITNKGYSENVAPGVTVPNNANIYPPGEGLGWSDADIMKGTYAWFCMQEASLRCEDGPWPVFTATQTRASVKIPPGRWYINREVRWSHGVIAGDGSTNDTYGNGSTSIYRIDTDWKSLYGEGQDNTFAAHVSWAYPGEDASMNVKCTKFAPMLAGTTWAHSLVFRQIRFFGAATQWYDPSKREVGVLMYSPGEQAAVERCYFEKHNDFGLLVDGTPAPFVIYHCSGFWNNVAQIGMRGLSTADIAIYTMSGDYNPYMIYMFRQGSMGPNGDLNFWPHYYDGNPGGMVSLFVPKLECYCCSPEPGYGTCYDPASNGKGQMLARLTGRFSFNVYGGTIYAHNGKVDSMIKVEDDYFDVHCGNGVSGVPMSGSSIRISGVYFKRFKHWLHTGNSPFGGDMKFQCYDDVLDPSWDNDQYYGDMYWNAQQPTVCKDPMRQVNYPSISGVWPGRQPYINNVYNNQWNQTSGPTGVFPYKGINVFDGSIM